MSISTSASDDAVATEHHLLSMPPESDYGATEYKYRLVGLTDTQKLHLASQLTWRLNEDCGQAIYEIGLTDDGFPLGITEEEMKQSLDSLQEVVSIQGNSVICAVDQHPVTHWADSEEELLLNLIITRTKEMRDPEANVKTKWRFVNDARERGAPSFTRYVAEIIIRKDVGSYWETRCGIAGNVDCGKSTLLGVLTSGKYDNGRGSARMTVMNHRHEINTGRTSSVSQEIIGFSNDGSLINAEIAQQNHISGKIPWADILKRSNKVITFFDLAGHLKYLSQTLRGLSSNELDYVLIIVGANMSETVADGSGGGGGGSRSGGGGGGKWINMTKEHMEVSLALGMRCIVVITKTDMVADEVRNRTVSGITRLIKSKFAPYSLDSTENVKTCVKLMSTGNVIPIVQVSNVTGTGHDILRKLLYYLPPCRDFQVKVKDPPIMQIQDIFHQVEGTATVIAGMLTSGEIHAGQQNKATMIKIGPLSDGNFLDARVRSIHCKRMEVPSVTAGKYVCLGLPKSVDGSLIRKNMFAVGAILNPQSTWEFWADITLTKAESGCVRLGYTPHCYIGHIKQTCKILRILEAPKLIRCEGGIGGNEERYVEDPEWEVNCKDLEAMSTGDNARVLMRFCFRPELIFDDDRKRLIFKEARTKGIGIVVQKTATVHQPLDNRSVTRDSKQNRLTRRQRKALRADNNPIPMRGGVTIRKNSMLV